jgi:protein TonB
VIGALREWFFGMMLAVSGFLHALLFLIAWLFGDEFRPPEAFAPQEGRASVRLLASADARPEPTKNENKVVEPAPPTETVEDVPEPLPVLPTPQQALALPAPSMKPVELPVPKPQPARKTPQPASVASKASQASEGVVDQMPEESVNPAPPYPPDARAAGQQGTVWVRITIDATGKVASARVQSSSGYESLDDAALRTVRRWVFRPATRDGRAVPCKVDKPFEFIIRSPY